VLGEAAEAERHFGRAIELDPTRAETHFSIGLLLRSRGRLDEAIASYRRAVELRPEYFPALLNLGSALIAAGEPAAAEEPLRRAVEIQPEDPRARNTLGVALVRAGDSRAALEQFAQASTLAPDWPQPLVARAWILATRPELGQSAEAVRLAERAAELSQGQSPVVLDTLAVAYAADNQFERAVATAEIARKLAEQAGKSQLAAQLTARLELLRTGPPLPPTIAPIE
jgi:Tfp pilus assembly protein PilF